MKWLCPHDLGLSVALSAADRAQQVPPAALWKTPGKGLNRHQEASFSGQGGPCSKLKCACCALGLPGEKATHLGDAGHVGLPTAAAAVAVGAGSRWHWARLPAQVSQGSPNLRGGGCPHVLGWAGPCFTPADLALPPAAGCVPLLGLPRAPSPSPLCSVYTSPSSPPAMGTGPAVPTGECPRPPGPTHWQPGCGQPPQPLPGCPGPRSPGWLIC